MNIEPTIRVNVDPANPGQFFACCGLLELADRLWSAAEGWFDFETSTFCVRPESTDGTPADILTAIARCEMRNSMTPDQVDCLAKLQSMKAKERSSAEDEEKKELERLWRSSPVTLGRPFSLTLDWFLDEQAGGTRFKTWAGQQSVIDIATAMKSPVDAGQYDGVDPTDWLQHPCGHAVTFNFDSENSAQSSNLDVGFVLDSLGMNSASRPLLELLAFVGLQRFRPHSDTKSNAYTYAIWSTPLLPNVAAALATSCVEAFGLQTFTFPLLYRTKYLKSFLPAKPNGGI